MDALIASGLFGRGLVTVDQPSMVARYNACLAEIGLPTTSLGRFRIDGWGWSPEIADEREDPYYLSHLRTANPYAIILSPEQKDKPVYYPYHSFDWHMMKVVFQTAESQIADLTTTTALWIDVDQEISAYREPSDLLMVDSIMLRFNASGGVMDAAKQQRALVHQFNNQRMAWADPQLHESIIRSVSAHGDLRFRSLEIPDIPYTNTRCFFTRAYGGLFVFRELPGGKPLLVMVNEEEAGLSGSSGHSHDELHLHDPELLPRLFREKLVDLQWQLYRDNPEPLQRIRDGLLAEAIAAADPSADLVGMRDGDRKRWMLKLGDSGELSPLYGEIERLQLMMNRGRDIDPVRFSPELSMLLTHPHRSLSETAWDAVRQLLVKLAPTDIVRTYQYDKDLFYERYATWPDNRKAWARSYLLEHDR